MNHQRFIQSAVLGLFAGAAAIAGNASGAHQSEDERGQLHLEQQAQKSRR
jgi:hypothetical protein